MPRKATLYLAAGCSILLGVFMVINAQKPTGRADDEKAIRNHIDNIVKAYMSKDSATVRKTHSKNWRGFLSRSTQVLRGIDDYMEAALAGGTFNKENTWHIVSYKMLDYDIVFHENTGIVNYVAEFTYADGNDKGSYKLRSIDIYGKENGHWNQLASNIGPLPENN